MEEIVIEEQEPIHCTEETVKKESFYHQALSEDLIVQLESLSPINPNNITYDELRYVNVLHYDFEGNIQEGELIVHHSVADETIDIFKEVFEVQYPIEKMKLVSEYNNDDDLSMEDNNTSAFNYRQITGGGALSNHAYGLAIDINPKHNPYVYESYVSPVNAMSYVDRENHQIGMIQRGDALFTAFISRGWTWGGDWKSLKDYQHFEKDR